MRRRDCRGWTVVRSERRRYHHEIALGADAGDHAQIDHDARQLHHQRDISGAGAIVGSVALGLMLGPLIGGTDGMIWQILRMVMVLCGAFTTAIVIIVQIMYFGQGTAMNPQKFELYGIDDHTLVSGLFLSGLTGLATIWGAYWSCSAWCRSTRSAGAIGIVAGIVAVPLVIITMMVLSKLCDLAADHVDEFQQRQKHDFHHHHPAVRAAVPGSGHGDEQPGSDHFSLKPFMMVADVFLVDAVGSRRSSCRSTWSRGSWGFAALRLLILVATWVVCYPPVACGA